MKKHLISIICIAGAMVLAASCGGSQKKAAQEAAQQAALDSLEQVAAAEKAEKVRITMEALPEEPVFDIVTNMGTIRVKLYSNTPKHRENFAKLALDGFYDGILFHRVINGFMIQAGDPLSKDLSMKDRWGVGGPGYNVPAEISAGNRHLKGALAAARKGDMANPLRESSGSQFYIVQDERSCAQLDGQYTVFGQTVDGFEVIDAIAKVQTDYRDRPYDAVRIESIKLVQQ